LWKKIPASCLQFLAPPVRIFYEAGGGTPLSHPHRKEQTTHAVYSGTVVQAVWHQQPAQIAAASAEGIFCLIIFGKEVCFMFTALRDLFYNLFPINLPGIWWILSERWFL